MSEPIKSAYPVQTRIITPINETTEYTTRAYIQFKINASELPMWLVNDSYLRFDINYTRAAYHTGAGKTGNTNKGINKTYIRNAANIFDMVKVKYGGDDIYTQTWNIEQNTIRMLGYGESYLNANYSTFTTNKMISEGTAKLVFDNGTATAGHEDNDEEIPAATKEILNVMIPVNQLLPMFMDVNSTGFPIGKLKRQLDIQLFIAEPYKFLVDYDDVMGDFSPYFRRCKSSTGNALADRQPVINSSLSDRYPGSEGSIKLQHVALYCSCYVPTNEEDAVITNQVNGNGMKFRYHTWHIGVRDVSGIGLSNNLPFSVTTENTEAFLLYCHDQGKSSSLMIRPNLETLYLRFGEMQLPFQPIPGDTWSTPFEYKYTTDDVLDNVDTYFSDTNNDYNRSYQFKARPAAATDCNEAAYQTNTVPGSNFVLLGANFVNAPDKLGSPSSRWNHQYQASFKATQSQTRSLRFILGVKTEYGMIVKNGDLACINI